MSTQRVADDGVVTFDRRRTVKFGESSFHPSHKKYASNAALKAQRPVKSLTRILIDMKAARITPVKNQSATMASAIFQSIGKCPRPLPHGPRKNLIAIPIRLTISRSFNLHYLEATVPVTSFEAAWVCLCSRANKTDPMIMPLINIATRARPAMLGGVGLTPQSCLSRRALSRRFICKHSIRYYRVQVWGNVLKNE